MKRVTIVIPFPERAIVAAYWLVYRAELRDDLQLKLAASVLLEAVRHGEPVPPDTVDRLALLAAAGPGDLEFRRRLGDALVELQEARPGLLAARQFEDRARRLR